MVPVVLEAPTNIDTHTISGHEIALVSHPEVWAPLSAKEMLCFLLEGGHLKSLEGLKVVDIGTGCGIIGILCGLMGSKEVTLTDYCHAAIEVAVENAKLNGVLARGVQSDRFAGLDGNTFDLIISNPPVQPWLRTDSDNPETRASPSDWNESGEDGRVVLDALIKDSQKYLSKNGTLITSCSSRHGHAKTLAMMDQHWKDDWKVIYSSEHTILEDYHGEYMPAWRAMQEIDNDLRVYQIDARQRRFAHTTTADGVEVILTTLKVAGKEIPVRFTQTESGWQITDNESNMIKEVSSDHPDVPGPSLTGSWYYTYYLIQVTKPRWDKDALGELPIPAHVYYGIHTERGLRNFDVSKETIGGWPYYLHCLAMIKKAAALANTEIGALSQPIADAICAAADEVIQGRIGPHHFPLCVLQGGGGVSTHMNMNEVLANRANEILTGNKGYDLVHPNDHVNQGQSTNDVLVAAFRLALHLELVAVGDALQVFEEVLLEKMEAFRDVVKLSRTCLQDAVPITLGQEFSAYLAPIQRQKSLLQKYATQCLDLPLGATAVGTGLGASAEYKKLIFPHLASVSGLRVQKSSNFFDSLQNGDMFVQISSILKSISTSLSKMATDLRILSSGREELRLPAVQAGSSLMPGKVNPAIPELINQIAYLVCGNDVTITMAVEGAELNLNVWYSVIGKCLAESCQLLTNSAPIFARRCIAGITVNEAVCWDQAEKTLSVSSIISALFGYQRGIEVARLAKERSISIGRATVELGLLSQTEVDELFDPMALTCADRSEKALARCKRMIARNGTRNPVA